MRSRTLWPFACRCGEGFGFLWVFPSFSVNTAPHPTQPHLIHPQPQKDPSKRPSAHDLLSHPFLDNATEALPGLLQMVGEYGQRKRPVLPQRGTSPHDYGMVGQQGGRAAGGWLAGYASCTLSHPARSRNNPPIASNQGTLPTWDFGSSKAAATTSRHAAALGTLRSADANPGQARDPRYLTNSSAGSLGGTAGGGVGSSTAGGKGTAARTDVGAAQQQMQVAGGTGTLPSGADALKGLGGGGRPWSDPSGAAGGGGAGDGAGAGIVGSGTVRALGGGEQLNTAGSGDSGLAYRRLPSLQGLSVDVGHVPGGGVAAGLPQGSGAGPEVTILRRFSRQESAAAVGEGDAALSRLLLPALRSLVPAPGGPEQVRLMDFSLVALFFVGGGAPVRL
jgi:hypothetical protein